jgi:hypothetical protein
MFLRELRRSLLRRWYLVLAGFAATGVLAWLTFGMVSPTYQARANLILLPPESSVEPGGNPYLYLGGLDQALDVLVRALNSGATSDPILESFPEAGYQVARDASTSGPIVLVEVAGSSEQSTLAALDAVLEALPTTLAGLQEQLDVPPASQITSQPLTVDTEPEVSQKSRVQAVGAVAAAGLAGTVMLTGLVDGMLAGRGRRRQRG